MLATPYMGGHLATYPSTNTELNLIMAASLDPTVSFLSVLSKHPTSPIELVQFLSTNPSIVPHIERIVIDNASRFDKVTVDSLRYLFQLKIDLHRAPRHSGLKAECFVFLEPAIQLEICADLLLEKGVDKEGIFRKTHSLIRPAEIAESIRKGRKVDMTQDHEDDLAATFKQYARLMYPKMLTVESIHKINETDNVNNFLKDLSADCRQFLAILGKVCRGIAENEGINLMSMENIAKMFVPNMFQHDDLKTELDNNELACKAIQKILLVS